MLKLDLLNSPNWSISDKSKNFSGVSFIFEILQEFESAEQKIDLQLSKEQL